jgi:Na+-transporting NADH:ubiquinone oxidoreductase subunit C
VADEPGKAKRSKDSVANTLIVSVGLSLVASVLVAGTAITLKPVQERNEERFRQQIILDVAGLYEPGADIGELFEQIETRGVDLDAGEYVADFDIEDFDAELAARDPDQGIDIPAANDVASLRRRARIVPVYLVLADGSTDQIILPVYGPGLWSTMRGFLAMDPDGNTVRGLRFYEHAETPGLGDQIDKPAWREQWAGKLVYADGDEPRIEVIKGFVDTGSPNAVHQVDGLAGATLTARGVTNLVQYWTGPDAFGPYLAKRRAEAAGDD